jgi:hypothetical protein
LRITAVIGMTMERKEISSSTKASSRTNAKTQTVRCLKTVLKSTVVAVTPATATRTPGTWPSVAGMTLSRKVVSARSDAVFSPVPASGTWMIAAVCAGLTMTVIGWFIWPVASAARSKAVPAAAYFRRAAEHPGGRGLRRARARPARRRAAGPLARSPASALNHLASLAVSH